MSEIHLALGTLLCENMAEAHLLVSHLARTGNPVALCSTLSCSCFHLWHFYTTILIAPQGTRPPLKLRYIKAVRLLFLSFGRGDKHAHHLAFHERCLIKIILYTIFIENRKYPVKNILAEFCVCQLTSAETD